ncbi:MAG: hypothetical protein ACK526_03575 [Planctomyces sp.]|jgi:hypothetical protein
MPALNRFHHQPYPTRPSRKPVRKTLTLADSDGFDFSRLHTHLGVRHVILVHGTFMGHDPLGLAGRMRSAGDFMPSMASRFTRIADALQENSRPLTMKVTKDVGNYTPEFEESFQSIVGKVPDVRILVPGWSSQNHHLARAELAVRLFLHLDSLDPARDDTILLWGHSHAGNAFAILSNLLANDRKAVDEFFDAVGERPENTWKLARRALEMASSPHPLARHVLIAAFGTPVRYGWDSAGYRSLVHVLHDRPFSRSDTGDPASGSQTEFGDDDASQTTDHLWTTKPLYPPHLPHETVAAVYGDWVQAFGIAGTDTSPPPIDADASNRLGKFLEHSLPDPEISADLRLVFPEEFRFLCARWKTGTRCHDDGLNLLVDYTPSGITSLSLPIEKSLLGHGVATTAVWLPAHLRLVTENLEQMEPN